MITTSLLHFNLGNGLIALHGYGMTLLKVDTILRRSGAIELLIVAVP